MEDAPPENHSNWRLWAAEKLGALREMARTNRERIITLEDEVGVDPPASDARVMQRIDELEREIEGAPDQGSVLGYLERATSSKQKLVATVVLLSVLALLIIVLASNDISLPFISAELAFFPTLRLSQLRGLSRLYEQEPQQAPSCYDDEEEQKGVHSTKGRE